MTPAYDLSLPRRPWMVRDLRDLDRQSIEMLVDRGELVDFCEWLDGATRWGRVKGDQLTFNRLHYWIDEVVWDDEDEEGADDGLE